MDSNYHFFRCNKLLGRHIAEQVPCQPANMRIDRRGNVISNHSKWDKYIEEYIIEVEINKKQVKCYEINSLTCYILNGATEATLIVLG